MAAPTKLFLDYNPFSSNRSAWKILDAEETCFGTGETPEDAIKSARVVTNAPIYANSEFKGIVDGTPVISVINSDELAEDSVLYGAEEMIEALAELGGFKVRKVQDSTGYFFLGYTMELIE